MSQASSEAIAMGVKAGLDPSLMVDVINAGSGMNTATTQKFPRSVLPGTFDYGFGMALMVKDVRLFLAEAEDFGIPVEVAKAVGSLWEAAMKEHGGFEHNAHGLRVVDVLERRYAGWRGLNLTYEVREAFAISCTGRQLPAV